MKKIIAFMLLLTASHTAGAAPEWKLKKENANLKIYTADAEHSAYKAVKVECLMKGNFSQVIAVLFDIDKHKEWVYNDKYSKLLKRVYDNELIYYSQVSVPWPCTDRDFIAHLVVAQTSPRVVTITSHAEPTYVPEKKGIIRIKNSSSLWTMTEEGNGMLRIVYVVQFDPGGTIPAWLINLFVTKGPYETFENLQQRVNTPAYRDAHYSFIKQ